MCPAQFEVKVRAFSIGDLDGICEIERLSFPDPWPKLEFQMVRRLPNVVFLVAELEGSPVGYVVAERRHSFLRRGSSGRILNLAVHPNFRRMGVGSRLLREATAMLNVEEVWLEVRKPNHAAVNFYLKSGFKPVNLVPRYYGDEDAVRMVKRPLTFPPQQGD
jgi:ribosomal-protein-alanine N-acetyltransferase